jgi:tetratricopeptide (TPR) repeat protein
MIKHALCAAAVLAGLSLVPATPAEARPRTSLLDSGGISLSVGTTRARSCYESALARSGSDYSLEVCDGALNDPLSGRDRFATLVNRAIVLAERGQLDEALDDINAAIERRPTHPTPHVNLGDVYIRMSRWLDAERAFTRGIELGPAAPQRAYFGRAVAREEAGDIEGAYADYMTAAELAPEWELPRRELARFQVRRDPGDDGA